MRKEQFSIYLLVGISLPFAMIGYLYLFIDPRLKFQSLRFHEVAIGVATLTLAFVSWAGYRAYQASGDPWLRLVTLAVLGFVLVYAPHGALTRMSDHHLVMFLIFGPVSRLVASVYLFVGFLSCGRAPDTAAERARSWRGHVLLFLAIDALVLLLSLGPPGLGVIHLKAMESTALGLYSLSVLRLLYLRLRTPWPWVSLAMLLLFIQASAAFLLARPWNYMWWLGHAISASGFFVLGYGVMRAYTDRHDYSTGEKNPRGNYGDLG